MVKIDSTIQLDVSVNVKIDFYIPLVVRTYTEPIGAVFYRTGNLTSSIIEIPLDSQTGTIRGISVVDFDAIGSGVDDSNLPRIEGLPVVCPNTMPDHCLDDPRDVIISLIGNRFFVDWSNGDCIDLKICHRRITFYVGNGNLLGAAIENVNLDEEQQLAVHISKKMLV